MLLDEGLPITAIADRLGLAKSTVCYHARRLGRPAEAKFATRYDWNEIRRTYESGASIAECAEHFGFTNAAWRAAVRRGAVVPRTELAELEARIASRHPISRGFLKRRLLALGLKRDECERCGLRDWRGRHLALALHHVNGDGLDNRLENLQLLCPNCHSQTPNFSGRNARLRRARAKAADGRTGRA